jgi:hypothetical protein
MAAKAKAKPKAKAPAAQAPAARPANSGEIPKRFWETAQVNDLQRHPKNYKNHPDDQIEHLVASVQQHGIYKNIVTANDGTTILAGHGMVLAARKAGHAAGPYRAPARAPPTAPWPSRS